MVGPLVNGGDRLAGVASVLTLVRNYIVKLS